MPERIKIGKMSFDTKSLLVGALVFCIGASVPATSGVFNKIYNTIAKFVQSFFKK